jgi:hypothetical protein
MSLNVHLYKELLRKCPVFYNISTEAMLQLLAEMRMSVATPLQVIVHEGQPNHNLYFIHRERRHGTALHPAHMRSDRTLACGGCTAQQRMRTRR